jgi:hypothetical protein
MKRLIVLLSLSLFTFACDRELPPSAGYVTEPKAPASDDGALGAVDALEVTVDTAAGVVFLAYDPGAFSGTSPGTDARSLDESIVRVIPTTRDGTVKYGAGSYTGRVFVLYGVSPGTTAVEVFLDGKSARTMPVTVLPQE